MSAESKRDEQWTVLAGRLGGNHRFETKLITILPSDPFFASSQVHVVLWRKLFTTYGSVQHIHLTSLRENALCVAIRRSPRHFSMISQLEMELYLSDALFEYAPYAYLWSIKHCHRKLGPSNRAKAKKDSRDTSMSNAEKQKHLSYTSLHSSVMLEIDYPFEVESGEEGYCKRQRERERENEGKTMNRLLQSNLTIWCMILLNRLYDYIG